MALDFPDAVEKVALIDILPNHYIWNHVSREWARSSWHWVFMAQPEGFPERMMGSVPAEWFMTHKLSKPGIGLDFMDPAAFAEYVRLLQRKDNPRLLRRLPGLHYLRSRDGHRRFRGRPQGRSTRHLVIWGTKSHTGRVYGDVQDIWRRYARQVEGGPIDCGHYVPGGGAPGNAAMVIEIFP